MGGRCVRWDLGGCPVAATGLSCLACGGCCNWPTSVHLAAGAGLLQPGAIVELAQLRGGPGALEWDWVEFRIKGFDRDQLREPRIVLAGDAEGRRWWLRVRRCGAVHYEYECPPPGWRGGSGGLSGMRVRQAQGVLDLRRQWMKVDPTPDRTRSFVLPSTAIHSQTLLRGVA